MKKILLLFLTIATQSIAQEKRSMLYAKLHDEVGVITNAHIINVNTKQGTYSNEQGKFRIFAKPNDTLQISFIGYETKTIKVKSTHFGIQTNNIKLNKTSIELDEVELKKNNLSGIILLDIQNVPKDLGKEKSKKAVDISMIDFTQPVISNIDIIDRGKAPNARKITDPTTKFAGIGGGFNLGNDLYSENLRKTRKEIKYKENFPKMLLSEFGEHFFFVELNIPKEKYLHFLEYCNPLDIEKLYANNKPLKVLHILKNESKTYLENINKKE